MIKLAVGDEEIRPRADFAGVGGRARAPLPDDHGKVVVLQNALQHFRPRRGLRADEAVVVGLRPAGLLPQKAQTSSSFSR